MAKTIYIASDHRGSVLKEGLIPWLKAKNHEVKDVTPPIGPDGMIDFPLAGQAVAQEVAQENGLGILICGSGIGVAIAANRFKGVRAAVLHSKEEIIQAKNDDHINVLCLSGDKTSPSLAQELIATWLNATEDQAERRLRRLQQLDQ